MLVIAVYVVHLGFTARLMYRDLRMNDFGKFYYSARQFLDGGSMYPAAPVEASTGGGWRVYGYVNTNPPHLHLPLLAIAPLAPRAALALWMAAGVVSLVAAVAMIVRELGLRVSPLQALWLIAGVLALAAMEAVIITGQLAMFLFVVMTLAWRDARRERWARAGAWLGLLASVKPFGLIFLPWLFARRRWSAVAGFVIAVLMAFVTGLAVFGLDAHIGWLQTLQTVNWPWAAMNASLLGGWSRWLTDTPFFAPLASAEHLVTPLWLASAALVGLLTLVACIGPRQPADVDRALGLLMLAALLISPLGWVYYWWLAVPASVAVFAARRPPWFWLALPWLFVPLGVVVAIDDSGWATVTVGSAYLWATLLLWMALLTAPVGIPPVADHFPGAK